MAKVVFGDGPSLILSNMFRGELDGPGGKKAFEIVVDDAIGGEAETGRIAFRGSGFKFNDGNVVAGRVTDIVFTGALGKDSGVSMRVTGLDVKAATLFDILDEFNAASLRSLVDLLFGGNDTVQGGPGGDLAYPGPGADLIKLGAGNDRIIADVGSDTLDGGSHEAADRYARVAGDIVNYAFIAEGVDADLERGTTVKPDGIDRLIGIEGLVGSSGKDTLKGDDDANSFSGGAGADEIDGRGGFDVVIYDHLENGQIASVKVDLQKGRATDQFAVTDKLRNVEGVHGGFGNDTILGDGKDNLLSGGLSGQDVLTGRGGADSFLFANPAVFVEPSVTITDFRSGEDFLVFDRDLFGLTKKVRVVVDDGKGYEFTDDRTTFVLRLSDGHLLYDADGKSPRTDLEELAILKGAADLAASDIVLI